MFTAAQTVYHKSAADEQKEFDRQMWKVKQEQEMAGYSGKPEMVNRKTMRSQSEAAIPRRVTRSSSIEGPGLSKYRTEKGLARKISKSNVKEKKQGPLKRLGSKLKQMGKDAKKEIEHRIGLQTDDLGEQITPRGTKMNR